MSLRQKIIRKIFRWSQALLEPPSQEESQYSPIRVFDHIPISELDGACNLLTDYKTIELSTVTHNKGKPNQYSCILLVGKNE